MRNAALYIGADPFTFNDMDIVRKCLDMFGFINIFLDRKNRDPEYQQYFLNYMDRADIIRHGMKDAGISPDVYSIIPIDETVEMAMTQNRIQILVLNFDYQYNTNFRLYKTLQYVNPNLNVVLLRGNGYVCAGFVKTLVDSDSGMFQYKKFCSDYAFKLLKIKTMRKIGITGNIGSRFGRVGDQLRERGFTVFDIDREVKKLDTDRSLQEEFRQELVAKGLKPPAKIDCQSLCRMCAVCGKTNSAVQYFIYQKINQLVADKMASIFSDKIAVMFSLMCELGMEQIFDRTIFMENDRETRVARLVKHGLDIGYISDIEKIQMEDEEKRELCDFVVQDFDDSDVASQTVQLYNQRLKREMQVPRGHWH